MNKCIVCGKFAAKCPKKVKDEYNEEIGVRKAICFKYAQAIPLLLMTACQARAFSLRSYPVVLLCSTVRLLIGIVGIR
jgi:heterodisulfide reductase subunit A-like polyferredoxin